MRQSDFDRRAAPTDPQTVALRTQAERHERERDLERRSIARELHDELGQLLNAARMQIAHLHRLQHDGPLPPEALDHLESLLAQAAAFTRRLGRRLRSPALDLGFVTGLEALCEDLRVRSGLACTLTTPEELPMQDFASQTVYRVVDEALRNIEQHADATAASVRLTVHAEGLDLEVEDDGVGLDPALPAPGLRGMQARVALLGGDMAWSRARTQGTRLCLRLLPDALACAKEAP